MREISFSLAEKTGLVAVTAAFLLFFLSPSLAAVPLFLFLLLCAVAPFLPGFSFFLPVISRGQRGIQSICLSFDDGPSPASTPLLLDLLARHHLPATFFLVGEKAAKYPELVAEILDRGHSIGNHSWCHDYFLMLRSRKTLRADIHTTQEILKKSGIRPLVFRPPVGITGSRLGGVLAGEGLITVTYSCRAFDRGNRNIHNLADKILRRLRPGDIIMLHDLPIYRSPESNEWVKELEHLFAALAKNYNVVPLAEIINRPVNIAVTNLL
ncbi:polysaccharide deacetylase family protein [Desulfocastanea catecholica]